MELFLAQNHSAMTHLPIACSILLAVCAAAAVFTTKREVAMAWAWLSILAFISALPTVTTGMFAARGRFNTEGKPYIESGFFVTNVPASARVWRHQLLGVTGFAVSLILSGLGVAKLRGRNANKYLVLALAVTLALLWGIGGHLGGMEMWGPETFPALK